MDCPYFLRRLACQRRPGFFQGSYSLQILKYSQQFPRQVFVYLVVKLYFKEFFPCFCRMSKWFHPFIDSPVNKVTRIHVALCSNFWFDFCCVIKWCHSTECTQFISVLLNEQDVQGPSFRGFYLFFFCLFISGFFLLFFQKWSGMRWASIEPLHPCIIML